MFCTLTEHFPLAARRDLLSNIVKANRSKVIVIDFWATWCGPCLDDFTIMKPIKEKLPADGELAEPRCTASWRKELPNCGTTQCGQRP